MHGMRLRVLTNRTKVPEVRDVLELLGGELEELPGPVGMPGPHRAERRVLRDREADGGQPRRVLPHLAVHQPAQRRHPPRHHRERDRRRHRPGRLPVRRPGHHRLNPRRGDVPAGGEPAAADHRHRLHQGRLHPRYPIGGGAVGGRAVRARLLRRDHAGPVGRCDRRARWTWPAGMACWPGRPAEPPTGRPGSTCGAPPPAGGARAAGGHHRLRPAGALPVLHPAAAP